MHKFMPIAVLAVSLSACGAISGPSSTTLEDLARKELVASVGSDPAALQAAKAAKIAPKGMCNSFAEKDTYVCGVEVTAKMPGEAQEATRALIVKAKKDASGNWVSVE